MVIDEKTKVIFLHNPKCGGMFFRRAHFKNHGNNIPNHYLSDHAEEVNVDLAHINIHSLPRFVPDYMDYRIISFVRNPYNRFVSALRTGAKHREYIKEMCDKYNWDAKRICNHILSQNYSEQDALLRSVTNPWFNPQSNYIDPTTIVLRFESLADWNFLLNVFEITEAEVTIRPDYELDDETKRMIRDLYFDDEIIFKMYE